MKLIKITKLILLAFVIGLFSCEMEDTSSLKKQVEIDEFSGYYVGTEHMKRNPREQSQSEDDCVQEFELWSFDLEYFGIVSIYKEGGELVIKYEMNDLPAALGIHSTWLVVSPTNDWGDGEPDWLGGGDEIMHDDTHGGAKEVIIKIDLEEWMERDCFYIATKLLLYDGSKWVTARAFIHIDGWIYIWKDPFCWCAPGTGTPGYWKNHDWPVDGITIGGVYYLQDAAQDLMKDPTANDKTFNMFEQLVAAKLNILIGNDDSCINEPSDDAESNDYIAEADNWMFMHNVGSEVPAESEWWQDPLYGNHHSASDIHYMLDEYNNGHLCAESRD